MDARWTGPHWSVSPHNFAPEVGVPSHPVTLHDIVTWRPGRIERAVQLGVKHVMVWFRASDEY